MRLNRWVLLASLLIGIPGIWFTASAFSQYVDAARSYTSIDAGFVDDSFVWLDPDYERARAELWLTNGSGRVVTVRAATIQIFFDGRFAGAQYDHWRSVRIEPGETVVVPLEIQISISQLRPSGGRADLSVCGTMDLAFDGIERTLTIQIRDSIGQVTNVEDA